MASLSSPNNKTLDGRRGLSRNRGVKAAGLRPRQFTVVQLMIRSEIRDYSLSDQEFLSGAMTGLQRYLAELDPEHTMLCPADCGVPYAAELVQKVQQGEGRIIIAMVDGKPVGVAAGIIKRESSPITRVTTEGEILELFVREDHRGMGLGSQLMQAMEDFFRRSGCEVVSISVFAPNTSARDLYERLGYSERVISLRKTIG